MAGALQVYGTEKLGRLGKDLQVIGGPTARGLRSNMRKGITVSVAPMKRDVQAAAVAIPAAGTASTGLRQALAKAVTMKVLASSRNAVVRLFVDPAKMKGYPGTMPALMEGTKSPWRHPVYGNREAWATQSAHPFFYPTVNKRLKEVRAGVVAAIVKTTNQLPKEM